MPTPIGSSTCSAGTVDPMAMITIVEVANTTG